MLDSTSGRRGGERDTARLFDTSTLLIAHPLLMSTDLAETGFGPSSPLASPGGNSASQLISTTPRSPSGRKEKAASRYLRASAGSCHDLCKYGNKHSFDEKEVQPFLLRRSISSSVPSKRSLKKFIAGRRKSFVKSGGSSAPKPEKDERTVMEIVTILPTVADAEDANGTKDIETSIPVAETDPSDDSGSVIMKDESPRKSTDSIDDLLPNLRSGSESPLSVVHDIHVVGEQDACFVNTELAEETELPREQHSSINIIDLIRAESGETETPALETTKSPVIRKSTKKGHLPAKTAMESVKSKVKREVSTPAPALPKLKVVKQVTPVARKSVSAKPTTSCKPIVKAVEQITPVVKSKSPPKSMGGLVVAKTKEGLSSDSRPSASPSKKTKLPSGLVGSSLNLTPPVKSKFQSTSPGSGLNATPPVKSKSRLVSTGDDPKTSAAAKSKPPVHPLGGRGRASVEKKADRSMTTPKVERKKVPVPSSVSPPVRTSASQGSRPNLIKLGSMNSSASLKSMKKVKPGTGSEKIKEKTIHIDESRWSNASSGRTLRSRTSRSRLSMSSLASLTSRDGSDCGAGKEARNLKSVERKTRKAGLSPQPEKEAAAPYKLKFRRGKVVNIQPESAPVATRLTFRRRRVVGRSPSGKGELPQRGHRRRSSLASDDGVSPIPGAGSIVLRHQTEEGPKKETQALLLNQVIEETASKLVETRKSKVKALVGAFETVISLQERKPIEL